MVFRLYLFVVTGVFGYSLYKFLRLQAMVSNPEENYSNGAGFGYVYSCYALGVSFVVFLVSVLYGVIRFCEKRKRKRK